MTITLTMTAKRWYEKNVEHSCVMRKVISSHPVLIDVNHIEGYGFWLEVFFNSTLKTLKIRKIWIKEIR